MPLRYKFTIFRQCTVYTHYSTGSAADRQSSFLPVNRQKFVSVITRIGH